MTINSEERSRLLFNIDDTVVHKNYGAGVVTEFRMLKRDGGKKRYCCIELVEDRGVLMIAEDQMDDEVLRPALTDFRLISRVLNKTPEELPDNHQSRQLTLKSKLRSGKARQIVQVLRDLSWREQTGHLTPTDSRLKEAAFEKIVQELALGPKLAADTARARLEEMLDKAINTHLKDAKIVAS